MESPASNEIELEKSAEKSFGNLCLLALKPQPETEPNIKVPVLLSGKAAKKNYTAEFPQSSQTARNFLKSQNAVVHVALDSIEPQSLVNHGIISQEMAVKHGKKPVSTSGTGFFITSDGWLVTNNHLACLTDDIKVQWTDGHSVPLRKVYSDPESDLAILKINWDKPVNLPYLPLAKDNSLDKLKNLTLVGYPNCWKNLHCSPGKMVGLGHTTDYFSTPMHQIIRSIKSSMTVIRTDCHSAQGGSGSPTLNEEGEVVGVNFAGPAPEDGAISTRCSFAIPVAELRKAIKHVPELSSRLGL